MNGHNAALSKVTSPVLVCVLVIDAIFQVVRKQVLKLNGSAKFKVYFGVFSASYVSSYLIMSLIADRKVPSSV